METETVAVTPAATAEQTLIQTARAVDGHMTAFGEVPGTTDPIWIAFKAAAIEYARFSIEDQYPEVAGFAPYDLARDAAGWNRLDRKDADCGLWRAARRLHRDLGGSTRLAHAAEEACLTWVSTLYPEW